MIDADDIKRLVDANAAVRNELANKQPRAAAQIVCDQLNWLSSQGSFWQGLRNLSETIEDHLARVSEVFTNLTEFIDAECQIFNTLGLDPEKTEPVVGAVYADIGVVQRIELENMTDVGFQNLKKHVEEAAKLVCKYRKSVVLRGVDWVVSWKGARILAGAAVAGANGLALLSPLLVGHPLTPLEGAVAAGSITVGSTLIKGDAFGLLDLLKPKG
jgi:hypothetical protein